MASRALDLEPKADPKGAATTSVFLNVYDLTPMNSYLYWLGLGVFHSGIEVYGMEYGFGAHELPTSGVFEVDPRSCPGFLFRRSVWLGTTEMSCMEFRMFLEDLAGKYHGDTYHLISRNCNHFTDDVCFHLTGKHVPGWVNRLARIGSLLNCLLPVSIKVTAVRHVPVHPAYSEDGSDSSSVLDVIDGSDAEEMDQFLLTAPAIEVSDPSDRPLRLIEVSDPSDRPLRLAKDLL